MKNIFDRYIVEPLLESIKIFPDRNAFCIKEKFYTFGQFGENISKIKKELIDIDDKHFGLIVNDDLDTYSSIFALWLEGKSYVPLHPKQPLERNLDIIEQMGIEFILDSSVESLYSDFSLINTSKIINTNNLLCYDKCVSEKNLAYILFTSGSTGKPKGVKISRHNIGSFVESFLDTGIVVDENDRCLQVFDLTFDVSVQSFLIPLTKGASIFTVPHEQIKFSYVSGLLEEHQITFGAMSPSMLRYLRPYFAEIHLPKMNTCIVTAEASPLDLVEEWQECIPNATIYNFYGPTEVTIYCTYYKIHKGNVKTLNGMLSIGRPMKHVDTIIIDESNSIVPDGVKGELCLTGGQVTSGYWNNALINREVFVQHKVDGKLKRYYHTGDICFRDEDSSLMLFGRKDSQVKIQGYRVELGEIEFHAREILDGLNVVVLPFVNKHFNTELAVFIESSTVNEHRFDNYIKSKLPPYMRPTRKFFLPVFPMNANDKVDKNKLKDMLTKYNYE